MISKIKLRTSIAFGVLMYSALMYMIVASIMESIYGPTNLTFFAAPYLMREYFQTHFTFSLLFLPVFGALSIYFALDTYRKKLWYKKTIWGRIYKVVGYAFSAYFLYCAKLLMDKVIERLPM